jgi:hypothetical protein
LLRRLLPAAIIGLCLSIVSILLLISRWQFVQHAPITLDLGDPATPASHFYDVEKSGEIGFRWSHSLAAVSLPALASSQVISITLSPGPRDASSLPTFRLLVDEPVVGEFQVLPDWHTYTATIGPGFSPDIRLIIESDSFYPSQDDRRLGLAIAEVNTAPQQGRFGLALPPRLWLLLAALVPILGLLWGRLRSKNAGWIASAVATVLLVAWSLIAPVHMSLPVAAWVVGLATLAYFLAWSYRAFPAPRGPFAWLTTVANSRWEVPAVALFLLGLTVVMTWPLVTRLNSSLPGWPGDNFAFLYKLWSFRNGLLGTGQSPPLDLGPVDRSFINTLPGVPLGTLFGDVVAYNLLSSVSFVISGLSAYLLVRELSGSRSAALLGSVAFAFCAYRMAHYAGHLELLGTGWIALSFYFLERMLKTYKVKHGALMGLCIALTALGSWSYAYVAGVAITIYAIARIWTLRHEICLRDLARPALAGAVILVAIVVPSAVLSPETWGPSGNSDSATSADEFSAAPTDYLTLNQLHPVWGGQFMRSQSQRPIYETSLYLGLVPLSIALIGWAVHRRRRAMDEPQNSVLKTQSSPWRIWGGLLGVALVLSFGLSLQWTYGQVRWPMAGGSTPIPLPGRLLYDWLPLYGSMHFYTRFGILVALAVVVLMGFGWVSIQNHMVTRNEGLRFRIQNSKFGRWLVVPAMCLLLADLWTAPYQWGSSRVGPSETSKFLAAVSPGGVIQFPLPASLSLPPPSNLAPYWSTFYPKPTSSGYDTFEPPEWQAVRPTVEKFPSDEALHMLRQWGVSYIVVSANGYREHWQERYEYLKSLPVLKHIADLNEPRVWAVDPAVLDARPDLEQYALDDTQALFELLP